MMMGQRCGTLVTTSPHHCQTFPNQSTNSHKNKCPRASHAKSGKTRNNKNIRSSAQGSSDKMLTTHCCNSSLTWISFRVCFANSFVFICSNRSSRGFHKLSALTYRTKRNSADTPSGIRDDACQVPCTFRITYVT